jgi:hypothetical protein
MPEPRRLLLIAVASAGLWATACESESYAQCVAFRDDFTALACTEGIDPGVDCNAYQDFPCPTEDYFDCLSDGHTCDEDGDLAVDVAECNLDLDCS